MFAEINAIFNCCLSTLDRSSPPFLCFSKLVELIVMEHIDPAPSPKQIPANQTSAVENTYSLPRLIKKHYGNDAVEFLEIYKKLDSYKQAIALGLLEGMLEPTHICPDEKKIV